MGEIRKQTMIDTKTGEIVFEKASRLNIFDEQKGYLFWQNRHSIRIFPGVEFPAGVTDTDKSHLCKLSMYLYEHTNMLAYRGNGNTIKAMTLEQMGEHIGLSYRNVTVFVKRMVELETMARVTVTVGRRKETQYYINPVYFFSGKRLSLNLYLLFRHQIDRYLPEWVREKFAEQAKMLGKLEKRGRKKNGNRVEPL